MAQQPNSQRRTVIKGILSSTTLAMVAASGLVLPQRVLAHWPKDAFSATSVDDALLALVSEEVIEDSDLVTFKVGSPPSYAVNGASVPIQVLSQLENIERLILLVEKNPSPLILSLECSDAFKLPFKTMIKIAEDSDVIAIIRAGDKLYKTTRFVEVDIGGCG